MLEGPKVSYPMELKQSPRKISGVMNDIYMYTVCKQYKLNKSVILSCKLHTLYHVFIVIVRATRPGTFDSYKL